MREVHQQDWLQLDEFPREGFKTVCFHALDLITQNREYLEDHLRKHWKDRQSLDALADLQTAVSQLEGALGEMMALLDCISQPPQMDLRGLELCTLVQSIQSQAEQIQQSLGVELRVEYPTHPCMTLGDWARAEEICLQLLSNALRACRSGGRVELFLCPDGEGWQLRVEDNGCGLPGAGGDPLQNRRCFLGGAGAGLLLCQAYCTQLGWELELAPRLHQGTQAIVRIPGDKALGERGTIWQSRRRKCWNNAGIRWPKECGRSFCCWRNRTGNFYDHTRTHRTGGGACPRRLFCCFETEILLSVKNLCIKTPLMMVGERKINKMFIYPRGKTCFFRVK